MTDTQASLSALINLSGKMRMLSHRAAMCILLVQMDEAGRAHRLDMFDKALAEFTHIHAILRDGLDGQVSSETIKLLEEKGAMTAQTSDAITEFMARAQSMRAALEAGKPSLGDVASFSEFVATTLLEALNTLTSSIASVLDGLIAESQHIEQQNRQVLVGAARSISDVSRKVKLISLNATIEAARAGEVGRSFGVIANEIRSLSDEANLFSDRLLASLKS